MQPQTFVIPTNCCKVMTEQYLERMTGIQLWHYLIQIVGVIQLNNNTMIISRVARGSLPRWHRWGPREAKLTPDCGLNFQSFRSRVLPKALCGLNFESRVAKQFAQMRQMKPRWGQVDAQVHCFPLRHSFTQASDSSTESVSFQTKNILWCLLPPYLGRLWQR